MVLRRACSIALAALAVASPAGAEKLAGEDLTPTLELTGSPPESWRGAGTFSANYSSPRPACETDECVDVVGQGPPIGPIIGQIPTFPGWTPIPGPGDGSGGGGDGNNSGNGGGGGTQPGDTIPYDQFTAPQKVGDAVFSILASIKEKEECNRLISGAEQYDDGTQIPADHRGTRAEETLRSLTRDNAIIIISDLETLEKLGMTNAYARGLSERDNLSEEVRAYYQVMNIPIPGMIFNGNLTDHMNRDQVMMTAYHELGHVTAATNQYRHCGPGQCTPAELQAADLAYNRQIETACGLPPGTSNKENWP